MADEDNPKFGWTFFRFLFEGALQQSEIGIAVGCRLLSPARA